MNDEMIKEVTHLERKLRKELSEFQQSIPIARIAQEMKKTDEEAERYVKAIREVVRRSPIVVITDKSGQKCAGIKVSPQKVSFRKPE
jgi:chemotaxis regulatin CheY-phosphate phosphatase CheZ